jgi:dynactin 1
VKFLRSENSYLKGQDLLKELNSLVPLPELDPSSADSSEASSEADSDEFPSPFSRPPPSLRSLSTATKVLYHDVLTFSSSPRVVDLSVVNDPQKRGGWVPQKKTPQHQLSERAAEAEKLKERLRGLSERTASASLSRKGRGALRTL